MKINLLLLVVLATVCSVPIIYFSIVRQICSFNQNSPVLSKSPPKRQKTLAGCLNPVIVEHRHSLWTLLSSGEGYVTSALKLIQSARINSKLLFDAVVLELLFKPLQANQRKLLIQAGWKICTVDRVAPKESDSANPHFRDQFTKLNLWKMEEYESVVYLDSDCLAIGSIDYLFRVHEKFNDSLHRIGVSRDMHSGGWRATFNMGVFVVKPNVTEFNRLVKLKAADMVDFDVKWSEQGFLNEVYKEEWFEIGFEFNADVAVYLAMRGYWTKREGGISVNKPMGLISSKYVSNLSKSRVQ
jgi:hypothetical protein